MGLRTRINIKGYNFLLKILNTNFRIASYLENKSFLGRTVSFDFNRTFDEIFPKNHNFKFIQIGGNDGISFDTLFYKLKKRKTFGLILEPSPHYYKILTRNFQDFQNIVLIQNAIFEKKCKIQLYELNELGLKNHPDWAAGIGSLDKMHLVNLGVSENEIRICEVDGISFSDLLNSYPEFSVVDYLQIDTEGYDYEILKMVDFEKFDATILKFEYKNLKLKDQKSVLDLVKIKYNVFYDDLDLVCIKKGFKGFFKF